MIIGRLSVSVSWRPVFCCVSVAVSFCIQADGRYTVSIVLNADASELYVDVNQQTSVLDNRSLCFIYSDIEATPSDDQATVSKTFARYTTEHLSVLSLIHI